MLNLQTDIITEAEKELTLFMPGYKIAEVTDRGTEYIEYRIHKDTEDSCKLTRIYTLPTSAALSAMNRECSHDEINEYIKSTADMLMARTELFATLRHDNLMRVEKYQRTDEYDKNDILHVRIYVCTPCYLPYTTYTADKNLTNKEVLKMGGDIAEALSVLHRHNALHPCLRTEDIYTDGHGRYILSGYDHIMPASSGGITMGNAVMLAAPETVDGQKPNEISDIYTLGMLMYKALNRNRLPFLDTQKQLTSYSDRKNAIEKRLMGAALPPPCDAEADAARVILRACEYHPEKRYTDMAEMADTLQGIILCTDETVSCVLPLRITLPE